MTWLATHGNKTVRAKVEEPGPGLYRVTLDDRTYLVDFLEPMPHVYSLLIDGRSHEVDLDGVPGFPDRVRVDVEGDRHDVEVRDARGARSQRGGARASGRQDIRSPMAGQVRKVLVAQGESVAQGQVLLILEAMKMQNQITAPLAGTVASVTAREGSSVGPGDPLCVVEPEGESHGTR